MTDDPTGSQRLSSAAIRPSSHKSSSSYWWSTTGRDLANMLQAAQYPEETQRQFLSYYKNTLCPMLGDDPSPSNALHEKSWTWDGSTHEYSFEFKGSTKDPEVRFVADFSQLRPVDWTDLLNNEGTESAIASFACRASGFDDTWYQALKRSMDYSHLSASAKKDLIDKAGHMTPSLIGFDISRELPPGPGMLPVMGKAYFLPCFAAAAENKTRFRVVCTAIRELPGISSPPNIISSLQLLEEYLASKPEDWENGTRYLATDFISPAKARLKIYIRCPSMQFSDMWDFFTLSGRILCMEDARNRYLEFVNLLGGSTAVDEAEDPRQRIETANRRKLTTLYFSLTDQYPFPAPKIAFCARNFVANDELVAQGLDRWTKKYGWSDGERSIYELVHSAITHRKLEEKAGIFTFIGLARKDPTKEDLSIQTYLCPELYETARSVW
ncbi:aromatic prenyltransferase [Mollisia scopiformis]|uniref:Aromatic prenyltransferase n=1 Tax=Mollisia scopiformis TaxID=149040 RepID=A0A194XLZ8_MOLSC|nr:aromatic prenyltransferase [Mollisia scopiformis]KUJ21270.1 aromatic prenyltransferase [Mollisia scopiformis]